MTLIGWMAALGAAVGLSWTPLAEPRKETALEQVDRVIAERHAQVAEISRPGAAPLPVREIPLARNITWTPVDAARPLRLRAGNVTLTIRNIVSPLSGDLVRPQITVEAPGRASRVIEGTDTWPIAEHMVGIGRLDRLGRPFVYYQGASGGMHCCLVINVAVVEDRHIEIVEMGAWEGGPETFFPRDVDGDGTVDFIQSDDRFAHVFGGTADSAGPPQILNIIEGRARDVSMRSSYRRLFVAKMNEYRGSCSEASATSGSCAAYVAAAARAGRFGQAWRDMLRAHRPEHDSELPERCRYALGEVQECPAEGIVTFATFPDALRHFLRENGYIAL